MPHILRPTPSFPPVERVLIPFSPLLIPVRSCRALRFQRARSAGADGCGRATLCAVRRGAVVDARPRVLPKGGRSGAIRRSSYKGEPKYHIATVATADSGKTVGRGFCAECGSPVVATQAAFPIFIIY